MRRLITLCLVATTHACRTYSTDNNQTIPLGCVSGMYLFTPWEPPEINTRFFVYDWAHVDVPHVVIPWNASLNQNDVLLFNPTNRLRFIIHGYTESSGEPWIRRLKEAILQRDRNTKIIVVDWSDGSYYNQTWYYLNRYFQASNNALTVGRVLACFIERIISTYGISETSVHVIGHSIGAQVMGRAVSWLAEKFEIRIGTGTATDAASPLFSWKGLDPKRQDVHFMLAIHTASTTSIYKIIEGAVGVYTAFADVNLYPNGGTVIQPACKENNFFFCSHRRGYIYLTEMITKCNENCDFQGFICADEREATNENCSNRTVNVCSFILEHKMRAERADRVSTVLTFETDMDQLYMDCSYSTGEQNSLV